jgi:hypothetical protein
MKSIFGIIASCLLGNIFGSIGLLIGLVVGFIIFESSFFSRKKNEDSDDPLISSSDEVLSSSIDDPFISSSDEIFSSSIDDPFISSSSIELDSGVSQINPATGLPMVGDSIGGIDVGGNPYGIDISDSINSGIVDTFDDSFSSGISDSFDDSFSSGFDDDSSSGGMGDDW